MTIFSTSEEDHQYLWGISAVPVRICSTLRKIISTCEEDHQYLWGYSVPISDSVWMTNEWSFPHRDWISPGTQWVCLTGVLMIFLTGTEDPHGSWRSFIQNAPFIRNHWNATIWLVGYCSTISDKGHYWITVGPHYKMCWVITRLSEC